MLTLSFGMWSGLPKRVQVATSVAMSSCVPCSMGSGWTVSRAAEGSRPALAVTREQWGWWLGVLPWSWFSVCCLPTSQRAVCHRPPESLISGEHVTCQMSECAVFPCTVEFLGFVFFLLIWLAFWRGRFRNRTYTRKTPHQVALRPWGDDG